ncbi:MULTISPECIES: hypothetical protein [Parafrankia]|uniref:Uncharacterized protein n=1 Tax=Parafrankia colletiae TaxID=573497 RepID=A0A1S1R4N1_9ACTN|nr:hypothetical protein [Parafrankia colletiae]MCK9901544.1 hypothetical protein [Frankia sp. Cpl3]OHV41130.1 hypothetical protein CC117_13070 [Parafrankia colletiae]
MGLFRRRSDASRESDPAPTFGGRTFSRLFGVSCAECRLGPASFTRVAAEAYAWADTHDQLHHPARSSAKVVSNR